MEQHPYVSRGKIKVRVGRERERERERDEGRNWRRGRGKEKAYFHWKQLPSRQCVGVGQGLDNFQSHLGIGCFKNVRLIPYFVTNERALY